MYTQQLRLATPRQWHAQVPWDLRADLTREHGSDVTGGKLTAPVHFWILFVAGLSTGCCSLNDLLSLFQARFGHLFGLPADPTRSWVKPAALSQRNAERC
jgi:hypothetical protein